MDRKENDIGLDVETLALHALFRIAHVPQLARLHIAKLTFNEREEIWARGRLALAEFGSAMRSDAALH